MPRAAAQPDLFADIAPARAAPAVDPADVRRELLGYLDQLRACDAGSPWSPYDTRVNRQIFPQMTGWLPADEAERLKAAFAAEIARLGLG